MPEPADWDRLGEMLQEQRVRLNSRYRNRSLFSRERGINYRLAQDVETGARDNYERITLTQIELAYGWEPGSVRDVLAGGEPTVTKSGPLPDPTCTFERSILGEPSLSDADKIGIIEGHRRSGHQLCYPLQEEPGIRRAAGLRA